MAKLAGARVVRSKDGAFMMINPKRVLESLFLERFHEALEEARSEVDRHTEDGENEVVSLPEMFPHGTTDITFMLFTKICRILGYERANNFDKVRDEAVDIINYAAFLIAYLDITNSKEPTDYDFIDNPSDPGAVSSEGS